MKSSTPLLATFATLTALALGATAQAAVVYGGTFSGNDCSGGGFANCYATTQGTTNDVSAGGSPTIYKYNNGGAQDFGGFSSITGSEFTVSYAGITNTLSFTYTPGNTDPEIHYITVKQANGYALFYDLTAPITSGSFNLDTYFPRNAGYSHISFYDTGSTTPPPPTTSVAEPASMALFSMGLLGMGLVRRRKANQAG